jgi:hypothetical protein
MDQQRKNISLLISLGLLILVSIFLFVSSGNSTSPIDPSLFKLPDPTTVDHVLIEKPYSKIDISYRSGAWRVNDSLIADRNMIDVLFATVEQAVPKRNAASRIKDSVIDSIKLFGIKVSFFSGEEIQKQFAVWGDENSGLTYFSSVDELNPIVMVIPGYRVQVSGIFDEQLNTWRDKRIFDINWRNFKELEARFPRDPKQDFTVAMTGRFFSIVNESSIDTTSLNDYLDAVSFINADRFYEPGESATMDSLVQTTPIMSIRVKDISDKNYTLQLFEIGQSQRNAIAQWGNDYVWFDRRNILPIYKKKKDFVK